MATLEALTQGARIRGLAGGQVATVLHANWIGRQAVEVTYKLEATGQVANQLVFRGDEATLEVVEQGTHRAFDTLEARFRLVMEATRIRMAYLFDPLLALSTSQVEAVPHQIGAVYETMLRRQPLCFLLAADTDAMETLTGETRRYLAWSSVQRDAAALNLDNAQVEQCAQAVASGDKTVALQLENAYLWLLAPIQEEAVPPLNTPTQIEAVRLSSGNDLASLGTVLQRASYRAVTDNHLITRWGPKLLQLDLQRFTLWQGSDHLSVRQLWQYLATYLYLPRLRDKDVLLTTIRAGAAATDFFGYAMGVDGSGAYQGLYFGRQPSTIFDEEGSVLVTPEAAHAALVQQAAAQQQTATGVSTGGGTGPLWGGAASGASAAVNTAGSGATMREGNGASAYSPGAGQSGAAPAASAAPTSFFGSVELNTLMLSSSAGKIGEEVVARLASLLGAEVKVRLEIEAHIPGGVPDKVQRDVTENARTLKFKTAEFE